MSTHMQEAQNQALNVINNLNNQAADHMTEAADVVHTDPGRCERLLRLAESFREQAKALAEIQWRIEDTAIKTAQAQELVKHHKLIEKHSHQRQDD